MTDPTPRKHRPAGWEAVADDYQAVFEPLTAQYAALLLDRLAAGRADGSTFLDVACGPGVLSELAAAAGFDVHAVDFTPGMIERTRRRMADAGQPVAAAVMDAGALDLATDSFAVAASNLGVIFVPEFARGLREMVRVVHPGGRVGLTAWTSSAALEWVAILEGAVRSVLGEIPEAAGSVMQWPTPADLAAQLITSGLTDVEIAIEERTWALPDAETFGRYLRVSPTSAELFAALEAAQVDAIVEAAVAETRRRQGEGALALGTEAYVAVGTVSATD